MTEKEMRPIVELWLQNRGYYVAHECLLSAYCDLIGCKWAERIGRRIPSMLEITTVELKVKDVKGVLYQANNNSYYVDYSYAAMPLQKCESMRTSTLNKFKEEGVGLLGVNDCITVIIKARKNEINHNQTICRRLWNHRLRHKRLMSRPDL